MGRINPTNFFRLLDCRNVQIHHNGFPVATDYYTNQRFVGHRVDFLMRDKRRHINGTSW